MKAGNKPAPIKLGERIADTDLIRRFQRGREIHPTFVPQRPERLTVGQQCDRAFAQAVACGFRSVQVVGSTYVLFSGDWYVWDLRDPKDPGQ
jgi:hypothetical protein